MLQSLEFGGIADVYYFNFGENLKEGKKTMNHVASFVRRPFPRSGKRLYT